MPSLHAYIKVLPDKLNQARIHLITILRLEEDIDMHEMAKPEAFKFSLLPICSCSPEEITKFMQKDFNFDLDGLLFYYTDVGRIFHPLIMSDSI